MKKKKMTPSPFGKKLIKLRKLAIKKGMKLLTIDEILAEIASLRCGKRH